MAWVDLLLPISPLTGRCHGVTEGVFQMPSV